ncbi:oligopeptide transporter 5-like [Zingiber officinale]|uniref:oligopeptide transporter 5-like n=1 Tax=Zingiber officinale TaxID=94328 RepID=UPI001C4D18EE|nr:oligopeptide transporter 5-like [Zingiber officinale]
MASAVLDHDPPPKHLDEDEDNDCPIEQVRLTVPTTDDPSQPCLTIRTWILGIVGCVLLAFVNQFFSYRSNQLSISSVCVQILALPIGRWMARVLPPTIIRIPLLNWSFSLNPGPFTMKEHVLVTIIASSGSGGNYAVGIVTIVKAFYHRGINTMAAMLLTQTTQLLGFGWAGLFRKYLVDSPFMWWPSNLIQVSLFRALNEEERRPKGGLSRLQFFLISLGCSFAYYIVPNYLFPAIGSVSVLCLIWKNSIPIQQIGSGLRGLGVGAFAIDWATATSWLQSPIAAPPFVLVNVLAGYVILIYILMPLCYWTNIYHARRFTFLTSHLFERGGAPYDLDRILDAESFSLDVRQYESYSDIYMSTFFAISYGIGFATLTATLSHVFLFDGQYMLKLWRQATSKANEKFLDVHGRMMKANYAAVPQWWFLVILVSMTALSIYACEGFGGALQLPYWGILLAIAMALFFTLPIGIIGATTNTFPGLNIITEMVIGYILPGQPMANVVFKTYGYISMSQAITFLSDFKLGHYMKIPPKSMFVAQLVGAVIANACYFGTAWWLLTSVPNICETDLLPPDTPWTCPSDSVFFSASIIWGVVGPYRMFGPGSIYVSLNYFFLIGLLAPVPVYVFHRLFPEKKWIRLINFPVIFGATGMMPPAKAINYNSWFVVGFTFNYWVFKRHKQWWGRYAYVLSAALDAGTSFMAVVAFFALGNYDIYAVNWWGGVLDDYCPLANCPTEAGAYIPNGCPQIQ